MKERKIREVNSKSSVTIQEVKKQSTTDKFLSSKPSKRCGHDTVMQSNNKGGKEATWHWSTTGKSCEKN